MLFFKCKLIFFSILTGFWAINQFSFMNSKTTLPYWVDEGGNHQSVSDYQSDLLDFLNEK